MLSEYRSLPVRYVRLLLVYLTLLSLSSFKSYLKIKLLRHAKFLFLLYNHQQFYDA